MNSLYCFHHVILLKVLSQHSTHLSSLVDRLSKPIPLSNPSTMEILQRIVISIEDTTIETHVQHIDKQLIILESWFVTRQV